MNGNLDLIVRGGKGREGEDSLGFKICSACRGTGEGASREGRGAEMDLLRG